MKLPIKFNDEVIIREPKSSDAKALMGYINPIIAEPGVGIMLDKPQSLKQENDYLKGVIKTIKSGKGVYLYAFKGDTLVGSADINLKDYKQSHVGEFGITVANDYRDIGLGSFLMKTIINYAKEKLVGLEIIQLGVFADNSRARHVYQKMGFKEVALMPRVIKNKGKYTDEVIMHKQA